MFQIVVNDAEKIQKKLEFLRNGNERDESPQNFNVFTVDDTSSEAP